MIEIESVEFHTEIFHAGRNFGKKIGWGTGKNNEGVRVEANKDKTWVYFHYNGRTREIPVFGNVASWEVKRENAAPEPVNEYKTQDVNKIKTAQVSTPMGHVFEGPGKGKAKQ